jgi:hypothetical protein
MPAEHGRKRTEYISSSQHAVCGGGAGLSFLRGTYLLAVSFGLSV